jgi:hypothetical protein
MADNTGAPWLLPYPESTDLVRDGAQDIEALATAVASGLTAANRGIGTNVVQVVKTDTFSTTSTSFTNVTGLTATITPSSDTSLILVMFRLMAARDNTVNNMQTRLVRGSTAIYVGGAAGVRTPNLGPADVTTGTQIRNLSASFLDSPATASPVSYSLQVRRSDGGAGTVNVNRGASDTDDQNRSRTASNIVLVEVAP